MLFKHLIASLHHKSKHFGKSSFRQIFGYFAPGNIMGRSKRHVCISVFYYKAVPVTETRIEFNQLTAKVLIKSFYNLIRFGCAYLVRAVINHCLLSVRHILRKRH